MGLTWREAIIKILEESDEPLHYSEIAARILAKRYRRSEGATPDATVGAQIFVSIKKEGDTSPFVKVDKGTFALRSKLGNKRKKVGRPGKAAPEPELASDVDPAATIIRAFGMYWQRDLVVWKNEPKLFGKQQALSTPVDFGGQMGLYILYDHHTVVYVGRTTDRSLGRRLYEHTTDRLGSRWNRFSWFGFMDVTQDGRLRDIPVNSTMDVLVPTLEALLIEALEPPQNRRRGDGLSGFEYIQDLDPDIKERELQNTLRNLERKMRESS